MQIESLRIHNFRVFQDVSVEKIPTMAVSPAMSGLLWQNAGDFRKLFPAIRQET